MIINEVVEFEAEAEETQGPEKAADIIKTKRKEIINVAYHQGQEF